MLRNKNHDCKLGTWNCRTLTVPGSTRILTEEVRARGIGIVALQEVRWKGITERPYPSGCMICQSGGEKHEFGTAFLITNEMRKRVNGGRQPINERTFRLRIRCRFFNFSIINVHSPHLGSPDDGKEIFYGKELAVRSWWGSTTAAQNMTIPSTFFQHAHRFSCTWRSPQQTYSQIDHILNDGRHFSDIIDIRIYRGANVDSDHFLVMVKLRQKLCVANSQRYQPTPKLNTDRLRQVLSEKNIVRSKMLRRETRQNVENCKRLRRQQTRLFQNKKRSLEESDVQLMEQLSQSGESRKLMDAARSGFTPMFAKSCRTSEK
ncbi:uncharacterized protein LOC118509238 [Anopheles stephensi]|uniref:uncharacterized protein LOC118509238 n=1 Tax=Anopheles stephensi TaxID=30069 RepID=UPI001658B7C7|nr:uncharacterized protein LOC118509238 [Anopheles stephensi]